MRDLGTPPAASIFYLGPSADCADVCSTAEYGLLYSTVMLKETLQQGQKLADAALERLLRPPHNRPFPFIKPCGIASLPEASACVPSFAWKPAA